MRKGDNRPVADFDKSYRLIQHDLAVLDILQAIGQAEQDFTCLLVKFGDADILEVWGINGIPWLWRNAELVYTAPLMALA